MTERSRKMSVIGRLDDQVEAVLINPLKRERPAHDAEEREQPAIPAPAPPARDEESSEETREVDDALPVWLL
jgi:hypothetical protein